MARERARLKDIAAATGFSANTVSLALRASPRIPEEARRLNYVPNHIARSLVSRATRTIGLVMTDIMNPTLTLAVPRDLAIVGYDDTEAAAFCSLPLTTVNYAADVISRLAVARMLAVLGGEAGSDAPTVTRIEPELVVRRST